jgi:hypothetical protein
VPASSPYGLDSQQSCSPLWQALGEKGDPFMSYKESSNWNEINEIRCLIIFKRLQNEKFPRNKQMSYCREIEKVSNLDASNLSAKVSNFKSVAGINKSSNASKNTIYVYNTYGHLSINELEKIIQKLQGK